VSKTVKIVLLVLLVVIASLAVSFLLASCGGSAA
jgi:hypothetical protein